ncbi:pilin [Patescibacteria group bacterium]|nr:pilin [Patescibacteria group bacterium]
MFPLIQIAIAQGLPSRLVPECDPTGISTSTPACNECFLAQMGVNIVATLIYVAFVIVIFMAISGGFRMFFSGGNPEGVTTARKHITAALIGLVIVLLSWTGLNIFITTFTNLNDNDGKWYALEELECQPTADLCNAQCNERYDTEAEKAECRSGCPTAR